MKHAKKLWALLLALVMAVGILPTAVMAEEDPSNPVVQFTIVKKVEKAETAATPPAETFEFVLEDTADEKKPLDYYGITLLDELKIETNGVDTKEKTIRAKIDMAKVNPNGGWNAIIPVGSESPSSYSKTFHITEKIDGKDGWTNTSNARYDVTFKYDCNSREMTCTVYGRNTDSRAEFAEFTNTYTKQAPVTKTVEIPFTKVVKLGGNRAPGSQTFELEIFNSVNSTDGLTITSAVETNGRGTYEGKLVITGPESDVANLIGRGFYVREKIGNAVNWTYSDAVWHVIKLDGQNKIYPATKKTSDNGDYYEDGDAAEKMSFTNIYTRNVTHTRPAQTTETKIASPKTFDAGIGIYAVSALLSVTGGAWLVGKKRK